MIRVIVNPISGSGRSVRVLPKVEAELAARGLVYEVVTSQYVGHATELARAAVDCEALVVVGGDGTLSEVVNGIDDRKTALYLVPSGTGNDFAKTLKLPRDPIDALRAQFSSPALPIDLPHVNGRRFINVSGTGFDIEVLRQAEQYKARHTGLVAYLLGLVQAIRHFKPIKARLTINGVTEEKLLTIVEVANGQYIGGGMRVAPKADPSDGQFDVVCVDALKKWQICLLLPLFIPGWYVHLPIAHSVRTDAVTLEADGMTLNIDGELVPETRAQYGLTPGMLTVHRPIASTKKAAAAHNASA